MNIILIAALFIGTKFVSGSSLQDILPAQFSTSDTGIKSQDQDQSLTRMREIQSRVSEQPVPLEIFLSLSPAKWDNIPDAHLTIFRIVPSRGAKSRLGKRDLGRLAGKIKQSIKRWSNVCNKTSLKYTAVLDTTYDSVSGKDNGIILFTGPTAGLLQYIHDSIAKQLPRGWGLDLGEYRGLPFVDIGKSDIESIEAWFQEEDIRFVVLDFSNFELRHEGDQVSYFTSFK